MVAMAKYGLEIVLGLRRPVIRCHLMTYIAGTDLALGRVAGITGAVCRDTDRYGLSGPRRVVTRGTSIGGATPTGCVCGVVKLHIKPLGKLCRKSLYLWIIGAGIRVAYGAHYLVPVHQFTVCKLVKVTAYARFVPAEGYLYRAALAVVAGIAGKLFVLGDPVRKLFKCFCGDACRYRVRRLR